MNNKTIKVIAFYLPQFHQIPENDKWWGKGFTEWTNVGKAKPLFRGHYQPRIPKDLGYYNLTMPEVVEEQVKLAKEAGVAAFCYYHYWFGNGKQLLEKPLQELVKKGKPNFPFCLAWANHSWSNKQWNPDIKKLDQKILIKQEYPGKEDIDTHFYTMLSTFKDKRYFLVHGKLLFMIYDIKSIPDVKYFKNRWQELAKLNGLPGFFFVAQTENINDLNNNIFQECDAVNLSLLYAPWKNNISLIQRITHKIRCEISTILNLPLNLKKYSTAIKYWINPIFRNSNIYPTIIPNWDHSARQGMNATILHDSTPELFQIHVSQIIDLIAEKNDDDKIIFLKSWNEWAEGNYMEPDLKFGKGYIHSLNDALNELN